MAVGFARLLVRRVGWRLLEGFLRLRAFWGVIGLREFGLWFQGD